MLKQLLILILGKREMVNQVEVGKVYNCGFYTIVVESKMDNDRYSVTILTYYLQAFPAFSEITSVMTTEEILKLVNW